MSKRFRNTIQFTDTSGTFSCRIRYAVAHIKIIKISNDMNNDNKAWVYINRDVYPLPKKEAYALFHYITTTIEDFYNEGKS